MHESDEGGAAVADASEVGRYWSVDECAWVRVPPREVVEAGAVPSQRDEAVEEPVDA